MVYVVCTRPLDLSPPISEFFQKENGRRCSGLIELLDEFSQLRVFYRSRRELRHSFEQEDYPAVWNWCRGQIESANQSSMDKTEIGRLESNKNGAFRRLSRAVTDYPVLDPGPDDTIAALYFTFHYLNTRIS
jgi:hypothetical protein